MVEWSLDFETAMIEATKIRSWRNARAWKRVWLKRDGIADLTTNEKLTIFSSRSQPLWTANIDCSLTAV